MYVYIYICIYNFNHISLSLALFLANDLSYSKLSIPLAAAAPDSSTTSGVHSPGLQHVLKKLQGLPPLTLQAAQHCIEAGDLSDFLTN